MANIFTKVKGMNIVGQGGKIILFMLPSLIGAILVNVYFPRFAALPAAVDFLVYPGYALLGLGAILWGIAIYQLLTEFPKGRLITTGAYGIVRNPIYASVALLVLPGVALVTLTWVYFVAAAFLFGGVLIFIGKEEKHLAEVFGNNYLFYLSTVDRLIPFRKPGLRRFAVETNGKQEVAR